MKRGVVSGAATDSIDVHTSVLAAGGGGGGGGAAAATSRLAAFARVVPCGTAASIASGASSPSSLIRLRTRLVWGDEGIATCTERKAHGTPFIQARGVRPGAVRSQLRASEAGALSARRALGAAAARDCGALAAWAQLS